MMLKKNKLYDKISIFNKPLLFTIVKCFSLSNTLNLVTGGSTAQTMPKKKKNKNKR